MEVGDKSKRNNSPILLSTAATKSAGEDISANCDGSNDIELISCTDGGSRSLPTGISPLSDENSKSGDSPALDSISSQDGDLKWVDTETSPQSASTETSSKKNDSKESSEPDDPDRSAESKNLKESGQRKQSEEESKNSKDGSGEAKTPQPALKFTIDFGDSKEVGSARYQNLLERYSARHRRNLSTSKVEIKAKKPTPSLSPNLLQKQKAPSTHSEGYFSSDQEDDIKRKADQLSRKIKQLGSKFTSNAQSVAKKSDVMARSYTEHSSQELISQSIHSQLRNMQPTRDQLSLDLKNTTTNLYSDSQKAMTLNNLSGIERNSFEEEISNSAKYTPEKSYTKNIEYIEVDNDYGDESNLEQFGDNVNEKVSNVSLLTDSCTTNSVISSSAKSVNFSAYNMNTSSVSNVMRSDVNSTEETNLNMFNISHLDDVSDGAVSEAGTYTIHKDYTDEEKARMDIDKVFGVGVVTEEESSEAYVHSFKMSMSRDSSTWISEWATQVAEHNSLPPPIGGTTGRTPPLSPSKIPSPIHSRSRRLSRGRQDQSDSSLETESYLRTKENINSLSIQNALIDSGGESDDDTSHSYNTPPHSSQRTPTHSSLARRGSLSEALLRRGSACDGRRSIRNYITSEARLNKEQITTEVLKSPSHISARLHLGRRNSSLDRKEYASDTAESNTSRRSSLKNHQEDSPRHTNSPIPNRLGPFTPKLTNSPILARKELATKILNSPILDRAKNLTKSSQQAKNIGYFTCTENSPYMLRKSNSTTNYGHEDNSIHRGKEMSTTTLNLLQNSPVAQRSVNIQRSSSNASVRNPKLVGLLARRSSFNTSNSDRASAPIRGRFTAASDSSSEAGEPHSKSLAPPISSGIKLNRAFSIRRARLNCESDTTPNTTPEERRRKVQPEVKSALSSGRQPSHHRGRTSSVGANSKEIFKKPDAPKPRAPSVSRTDSGRFSMRAPKSSNTNHHTPPQRPNQKPGKDHKKPGRSNSTLTSKEVEFQNWKRRKNYDPMKAAAEGKKKLEVSKKRNSIEDGSPSRDNSVLRSASFHGTGGTLTLALAADWSDNELNISTEDIRPPPPCSPQLGSDSDLETSSYLRTTENVVSAMSARMTVQHPPLVDSGGESDEDTSHSMHQPMNRMIHPSQASDTESSDDPQPVVQSPITNTKYNRAFSLRRARLELPELKVASTTAAKVKVLPRDIRGKSEPAPNIARTDSGRFSMRLPRASNTSNKPRTKEAKKPAVPSSKEVEMQNWKRRKSYDPMKAAMEGKRKAGLTKRNPNMSPSHVLRSQSFHGSVGIGVSDWSDEELTVSADEASLY